MYVLKKLIYHRHRFLSDEKLMANLTPNIRCIKFPTDPHLKKILNVFVINFIIMLVSCLEIYTRVDDNF